MGYSFHEEHLGLCRSLLHLPSWLYAFECTSLHPFSFSPFCRDEVFGGLPHTDPHASLFASGWDHWSLKGEVYVSTVYFLQKFNLQARDTHPSEEPEQLPSLSTGLWKQWGKVDPEVCLQRRGFFLMRSIRPELGIVAVASLLPP